MRGIIGSRPSPAIVVAVVALVAAVAGTAMAGPGASSSAITKKKVNNIAEKQANAVIDQKAPGLSVASAQSATNATNATNATTATNAGNAANANALQIYAHVNNAGVVDDTNSRNVTVTKGGGNGLYCFSGLPFTPKGVVASVDSADSQNEEEQVGLGAAANCPAGTQAFVVTRNPAAQARDDAGFFATFYG